MVQLNVKYDQTFEPCQIFIHTYSELKCSLFDEGPPSCCLDVGEYHHWRLHWGARETKGEQPDLRKGATPAGVAVLPVFSLYSATVYAHLICVSALLSFLIGRHVALRVQRIPHAPSHVGYLQLQVHRDNGFDLRGALRGPRPSGVIASGQMEKTAATNRHRNTDRILTEAPKRPPEARFCSN